MKFPRIATMLALLAGSNLSALAQAPAVVQLPSFSTFGVNTSVSVPDRGSIPLAGVGRASTGSTAYGPSAGRGNRAAGSNLSTSRSSARASIHDTEALDRDTLARAKGSQSGRTANISADPTRRLASARQSSAGEVPSGSVADARRQRATEAAAGQAEAVANWKRAREAAAAGKTSLAAVLYRLAAKQSSGELKSKIEKEAAALAKEVKTTKVAKTAKESDRGS
jgi:hypothetical protein